jgi:aspartate aminotransferase-like enzyme
MALSTKSLNSEQKLIPKNKNPMPERNILLTPGPTPVPPSVLKVMSEPIFHHRTPRYRKLFEEVSEQLKSVFRTQQAVYTFTGSGTLAMEAGIVNFLSPGDKMIVLEAGKFSERWSDIGKRFGLNVVSLKVPYGEIHSLQQVEEALKSHSDAKVVYGTLCETSTGVLQDVEGIAKLIAKTNAIFAVDAISGLCADPLEMDQWKVDIVVSGSQKGLMVPPGLSFLAASPKALSLHKSAKLPRFYIDLAGYQKSLKDWDTPFTPALTLVLALKEALRLIREEGMEKVWARTEKLAQYTRRAVGDLKLEFFAKKPANTLTAVKTPAGIDGEKLVATMRDQKGVVMAGGQGDMKGQLFRIAHLGFITEEDVKIGISVLKETLQEMKNASKVKV